MGAVVRMTRTKIEFEIQPNEPDNTLIQLFILVSLPTCQEIAGKIGDIGKILANEQATEPKLDTASAIKDSMLEILQWSKKLPPAAQAHTAIQITQTASLLAAETDMPSAEVAAAAIQDSAFDVFNKALNNMPSNHVQLLCRAAAISGCPDKGQLKQRAAFLLSPNA
jgi:hypothetical protein